MSPSPGDHPDRKLPVWMDRNNLFGRLHYLFLRGAGGQSLPKNPFTIGKSVENHAGKIESGYYDSKNQWYVLKVRNEEQVKKLELLKSLIDGTKIEIGRHPNLNTRKFVVQCHEVGEMTNEELLAELIPQKITKVQRITRKTSNGIVGTSTFILTVNSTVIPEFIDFGLLRLRTRVYYPLPLLCRKCLEYGHPKAKCTNQIACIKCSGKHESTTCRNDPFCLNCKENHSPVDRSCKIWKNEAASLKLAIDLNISLAEARKSITSTTSIYNTSYAGVAKLQPHTSNNHQNPKSSSTKPNEVQQKQHQPNPNTKRSHQKPNLPAPTEKCSANVQTDSPPKKRNDPQPLRRSSSNPEMEVNSDQSKNTEILIFTHASQCSSATVSHDTKLKNKPIPFPFPIPKKPILRFKK
ncbi:uncharacterized protein LOC129743405 [Uranotaenia lowii]|uniref:uncharacterized protein LOC129743405 n=1 Tax=Uranotaenia lowii TaxID=190385 RepID=UPI002479F545|nr:uncharacterized protein LOC129743405 [Uranotaenia lowii]